MLNQEKTGRFMAEMRRQQNLTQRQLAEQVGVSDKTVSKWETGRSMPDNAILLDVCLLLNISVNELLSGEKFTEENYVDKSEETMIELVKETEYHKQKGNWTIWETISSFLLLIIACSFTILSTGGMKSLSWFIDMPSIIILVGITFFVLIASESLWDFYFCGRLCCNYRTFTKSRIIRTMYGSCNPVSVLLFDYRDFVGTNGGSIV